MKNSVPALKGLKMFTLRHASLSLRSKSEAKSLLRYLHRENIRNILYVEVVSLAWVFAIHYGKN